MTCENETAIYITKIEAELISMALLKLAQDHPYFFDMELLGRAASNITQSLVDAFPETIEEG